MRTTLAERLPADSPQLALFDETILDEDRRASMWDGFAINTKKAYERRYERYKEWCRDNKYQTDPAFITTEKVREHVVWMTRVKRRSPSTVWQAIRSLELHAEHHGVDISVQPALRVLDRWRDTLEDVEGLAPRKKTGASRRTRPRGPRYASAA